MYVFQMNRLYNIDKPESQYAAFYGNLNLCKFLIELGADMNLKDEKGRYKILVRTEQDHKYELTSEQRTYR